MKLGKKIIYVVLFILLAISNIDAKTEFIKIELDYFTYIVHKDTEKYDIIVSDGEYTMLSGNYIISSRKNVEYTLYYPNDKQKKEMAIIKADNDGSATFILFGTETAIGKWSQMPNSDIKFEIKNTISLFNDNTGLFIPSIGRIKPIDITWNKIDTNIYQLGINGAIAKLNLYNNGDAQFYDDKKNISGKWSQIYIPTVQKTDINTPVSTPIPLQTEVARYLCPEGYVLTADHKCIQPKETPGFNTSLVIMVITILIVIRSTIR